MNRELRTLVQTHLDRAIERIVPVEHGWDSSVFEVNGDWIVRIPRRPEVEKWMRKEAALLPLLAPGLPLPIPHFEVVEDSAGFFFVAYRKLEGERLDATVGRGRQGKAIASQLGAFLAALHAFPRSDVIRAALDDVDNAGWFAELRALSERARGYGTPEGGRAATRAQSVR